MGSGLRTRRAVVTGGYGFIGSHLCERFVNEFLFVPGLNLPVETLKVGSIGTLCTLGLARAKGARYVLASTSEVYGAIIPARHCG